MKVEKSFRGEMLENQSEFEEWTKNIQRPPSEKTTKPTIGARMANLRLESWNNEGRANILLEKCCGINVKSKNNHHRKMKIYRKIQFWRERKENSRASTFLKNSQKQ